MGSTVTFCYCRTLTANDTFSHRTKLRTAQYGELKLYLSEQACVPGATADPSSSFPYVDALVNYYLVLLRSELNDHNGDQGESVASMQGLALVFAELWTESSLLSLSIDALKSHPLSAAADSNGRARLLDEARMQAITSSVRTTNTIAPDRQFTYEFGRLVSSAVVKAFAELEASIKTGDLSITKHHGALLGDLLDDMLDLVQYPYEDHVGSEHSLPDSHPHALRR